jgi:hypothetical protein
MLDSRWVIIYSLTCICNYECPFAVTFTLSDIHNGVPPFRRNPATFEKEIEPTICENDKGTNQGSPYEIRLWLPSTL